MEKVSFTQLREVVEFINETFKYSNATSKSKYVPLVKDKLKKTTFDDFETLKDSIENDYVDIYQWVNSDYFEHEGYLYSADDYCITRDGDAERREDCNYCDFYNEYTMQDCSQVYIRRQTYTYCQDAIDEEELHYYQGEYYDSDALAYNDLCEIDGSIYNQDECYYYDGEWHTEEEDIEQYVRNYHYNEAPRFVRFSETPEYFIGFEIEKEDLRVKESITIHDFEDKFPKWRKEKDASLKEVDGYELVTPAFELNVDEIAKVFSDEILKKHTNANFTENCGGHLNISKSNTSGLDFFRSIEGYTPLIYALYSKRLKTDYCKGKSNEELKNDRSKYQAINIKNNYVEYRIFSAIPNVDTLIWRTKLMKAIVDNPTSCVKQAFLNVHSVLKPILSEQYSTPERFERLLKRLIKYTMTYEGINPTDSNENEQ
jgi:hypothetical protein